MTLEANASKRVEILTADVMCSLTHYSQIVFDECHKAKNLCPVGSSKPTKTGLAVLELQNKLPKARVVYASATGEYVFKKMCV